MGQAEPEIQQIHETLEDTHIQQLLDERQRLEERSKSRSKFEETAKFSHIHGKLSTSAMKNFDASRASSDESHRKNIVNLTPKNRNHYSPKKSTIHKA